MTADDVQQVVVKFLETYRGAQALRIAIIADDPAPIRQSTEHLTEGRVTEMTFLHRRQIRSRHRP